MIDLKALRSYLHAIGAVLNYAGYSPDVGEVLAALRMLHDDAPRTLAALEGRA
jgi:hypothetical protein